MIRPEKMENIGPTVEPQADHDRNGLHDEVADALASLPEKQQEVLYLREFEDLDYEEIAEQVSVPVGTVRSRLHYAKQFLQGELKDYLR